MLDISNILILRHNGDDLKDGGSSSMPKFFAVCQQIVQKTIKEDNDITEKKIYFQDSNKLRQRYAKEIEKSFVLRDVLLPICQEARFFLCMPRHFSKLTLDIFRPNYMKCTQAECLGINGFPIIGRRKES